VSAGAFGAGLPARDLWLSSGHAVGLRVMDEVLVPIGALVNGATIVREDVVEVTYWHVELASHDVILAEGLPCESYLDLGNRLWFGRAYGRLAEIDPDRSLAGSSRPVVSDEPSLEAIRLRLDARARAMGWTASCDMDLHLVVDGVRIEPTIEGDLARFIFPAKAKRAELRSRPFTPSDLGPSLDDRRLGICIQALKVGDGLRAERHVALDELAGCHPEEAAADCAWRWTNGALDLPARLWDGCRDEAFLTLQFAPHAGVTWATPRAATDNLAPLAQRA
jgi:hypothetical protein